MAFTRSTELIEDDFGETIVAGNKKTPLSKKGKRRLPKRRKNVEITAKSPRLSPMSK